jgi:hypothetical protein
MIEKITASANEAIAALKGSPMLLTLVLFQFALLGAVIWISHEQSGYEHRQFELLLAQCKGG